jgi:hypothetical protein
MDSGIRDARGSDGIRDCEPILVNSATSDDTSNSVREAVGETTNIVE